MVLAPDGVDLAPEVIGIERLQWCGALVLLELRQALLPQRPEETGQVIRQSRVQRRRCHVAELLSSVW